ncbi:hypothetical protein [Streptomyces jumonjinensis]|uniref:hypothetical protein n=1 Tax=Streptomyces jumonjinensis TaxID=1945 RepID=UPI0037BAEC73
MMHTGAEHELGTVLLLAAAPARGRLIDASAVIQTTAAVPPAAWTGTRAATLIELADPADPHAVLARIRGAVTTEGPLTVVVVGQLQLDRRQHGVHVALARTTRTTVRYSALPWPWLVAELQQRRPGTTTVYAELVADPAVWQLLQDEPLDLPGGARTFGVIAPPPGRRRTAHPLYIQALAQILRTGHRAPPEQLHRDALRRADAEGAIVLGPDTPAAPANGTAAAVENRLPALIPAPPAPPTLRPSQRDQRAVSPVYVPSTATVPIAADPHQQIVAASQAGQHRRAAELAALAEQRAVTQFGADTPVAVHWTEVRAHLASVAQEPAASCALWLRAAEVRLDVLQQAPGPETEAAVDRAHHQWTRIRDTDAARGLAPQLLALRHRVPGRQPGALQAIQRTLERLNTPPHGRKTG